MAKNKMKTLHGLLAQGVKPSQPQINSAIFEKLEELDQNAGTFRPTDYRKGRAGVSRNDPGRFKGGILETGIINFPNDAPKDHTMTLTWTGKEFARLLGTTLNKFTMNVYGDLEAEAGKVSVTLRVNGTEVDELLDAPLASIISTVDGDGRYARPAVYIPEYCQIEVTVIAHKALTGPIGTTSELFATAWADSSPGSVLN